MGLLKQLRSRSKIDKDTFENTPNEYADANGARAYNGKLSASNGRDCSARLPTDVLKNIFAHVCPHTTDASFDTSENAQVGDGCMLCGLRDLANCAKVRRAWYKPAQEQLYQSVRIDPVHYCELEDTLADRRRRKSRHSHGENVPAARLRLLANTLKDRQWLGSQVNFLKLPYMARETCKADLARAISACPNLRYVDLPDGFYSGDPLCATIRQELEKHCPDMRHMKYYEGSEQFFHSLTQQYWRNIQVLELRKLRIDTATFRTVIATLYGLRELKVTDLPCFTDDVFNATPHAPNFPPLQSLILDQCGNLTTAGLNHYLGRPETREALTDLSLTETGIRVPDLASILWSATQLISLTFIATVSHSLPLEPLQPLTSLTLQTLHFEITPSDAHQFASSPSSPLPKPSDSYYTYLLTSLLSNTLPALRTLHVCDPGLPDALLLGNRTRAPFLATGPDTAAIPPRGFTQPLEVYTKGLDEAEWVFNAISPSGSGGAPGSRAASFSGGRPLSAYSTSRGLGPQWGGEARRSVVVGDGSGGFLAVPTEDEVDRWPGAGVEAAAVSDEARGEGGKRAFWRHKRVASSPRETKGSRADLWR